MGVAGAAGILRNVEGVQRDQMSRHIKIRIVRLAVLVAVIPILAWAYYYGPPAGVTTAPTDLPGVACTYCHNDTSLNQYGNRVSVNFTNGLTYVPGQTQTFTIVVNDSAAYYGFQATMRTDSSGGQAQAGNFTAASGTGVVCSDGSYGSTGPCNTSDGLEWIEHINQPIGSNQIPLTWTAPAASAGNVHLYVAVNAANGDHSQFGDHIYAVDYVLTPAANPNAPVVYSGGIVNAASGSQTVQSGSFVSIYGKQFATTTTNWDASIFNGVFPTTLGGVSVTINGKQAAVNFVSPGQVNVLAPADTSTGPVSVVVTNSSGPSTAANVTLAPESPAFFTFSQGGGKYIAAQIALANNAVEFLGPANLFGASPASRPAKPGEIIILYGTGFGPTNPAVDPTKVFSGAAPTNSPVTVTIGGKQAAVEFAGLSAAGLYQINVVVPSVAAGDQPVTASVNSVAVTQKVYVTVGN